MKFNKGDYIRYTANQEQEVIDGLIGLGYAVYDHKILKPDYKVFLFIDGDGFWLANDRYFARAGNRSGRYGVDRTEEFFAYLSGKNSFEEQLPEKFYIDCGDRIEVREWLDGMGYSISARLKRNDIHRLTSQICSSKDINGNLIMEPFNIGSIGYYEKVIPKIGVTSFEVESFFSNKSEAINKELQELKQAHKELGERIDKLCE